MIQVTEQHICPNCGEPSLITIGINSSLTQWRDIGTAPYGLRVRVCFERGEQAVAERFGNTDFGPAAWIVGTSRLPNGSIAAIEFSSPTHWAELDPLPVIERCEAA